MIVGLLMVTACKKDSPAPPSPQQTKNPCAELGRSLALAMISEPKSIDSQQLKVHEIQTSHLTVGSTAPAFQVARVRFEVSTGTSFVRWRACNEHGACLPSNRSSEWMTSISFDELLIDLPKKRYEIIAQACTDFPSKGTSCGKTTSSRFIPTTSPNQALSSALQELRRTDEGLWREGTALQEASRTFLEATTEYLNAVRSGKISDDGFQYLHTAATNMVRLGNSETWKFMQLGAKELRDLYESYGQERGLELSNATPKDAEMDCPKEVETFAKENDDAGTDDLLSSILGQLGGDEPSTSDVEQPEQPSLQSDVPQAEPSDNSNSNDATADTPTPAATDEPLREEKPKNPARQRTGGWLIGMGIVGISTSLATFAATNADGWKARWDIYRFNSSLGKMNQKPAESREKEVKQLANDLLKKLPTSYDVRLNVTQNGQPTQKSLRGILAGKQPLDELKGATTAFGVDAAQGPIETKNIGKSVGFVVLSSFITMVGTYMASEQKLAAADHQAAVSDYLETVWKIQEAVEELMIRRQKAAASIAEAGGPPL